jgi:hypothetical protein
MYWLQAGALGLEIFPEVVTEIGGRLTDYVGCEDGRQSALCDLGHG